MTSLADFLRARIHEEESLATPLLHPENIDGTWDGGLYPVGLANGNTALSVTPEYAIAECTAKLLLVMIHVPRMDPSQSLTLCEICGSSEVAGKTFAPGMTFWPCRTLKILASPYVDHPDFQDDWKLGEA